MRIGIIASSGGSTFDSMRQILAKSGISDIQFFVATDRACGIERTCQKLGYPQERFLTRDNQAFSTQTADWFASKGGVDLVLLYYLRLVTRELFERFPTFNIHPSLLPAFQGFNPIERAQEGRVRFLGATAHRVTAEPDGGPIVAQVNMPIAATDSVDKLHKYSFIQKVYLSLLLVEMARSATPYSQHTDRCNPKIESGTLWEILREFQCSEGVEVIR